MPLDTRSRTSIYEKLLPLLGEDDASTLMDQFPATPADELVTVQVLHAELADVRTELRAGMADLRAEMADGFRRQTQWTVGAMVAMTGIFSAIAHLA
jgi:hypothetical protein